MASCLADNSSLYRKPCYVVRSAGSDVEIVVNPRTRATGRARVLVA
jgi:hypothetical protein